MVVGLFHSIVFGRWSLVSICNICQTVDRWSLDSWLLVYISNIRQTVRPSSNSVKPW